MWNSNCLIITFDVGGFVEWEFWLYWQCCVILHTISKEQKVSLLKSFLLGKCMSCCYNTKFISFFSFFPFQLSNFVPRMKSMLPWVSLLLCVKVLLAKQKTQDVCSLGAVDTFVSCTINYFYQLTPQPEQDKASPKLNSFVFVLQNSSSFMTPSFLFAWRLNPQKDLWLFVQHFFCCFDILLLSWEWRQE